jgi:hypothetical protein
MSERRACRLMGLGRSAHLQADGIGTIGAPLSGAESGAGQRTANPPERAGGPAHAVWLSATEGDAGAGNTQFSVSLTRLLLGRLFMDRIAHSVPCLVVEF